MKRVLFSMVLLMTVSLGFAQVKTVREAKRLAEDASKPDFDKAQSLINEALSNPETKDDPNTWNVAGIIQQKIMEKENEKAYLRQPYDTVKAYNSIYDMIGYYLKADELEQIPDEKGKVKFKYRKGNATTILAERPNLINGGIYYFNQDDNKEAFKYFARYVDVANEPILASEDLINKDTLLSQVAYYATLAAMREEDYKGALKYAPLASRDAEVGKYAMEYMATAYKMLGDTVRWVETLQEGVTAYPDYSYFFGHLVDYYTSNGKFEDAMIFTDKMLEQDPNSAFGLYVKGYLYQHMKDYDNVIDYYKRAIEADPEYAEAYANLGLVYAQMGLDYADKVTSDLNDPNYATEQAKVKTFYENARSYYEKARELKPDQKDLWLNGLYTIYYRLALEKEFEEIEELME